MTFGEYRKNNIGWTSKIHLEIITGKNYSRLTCDGADFEEDEEYEIDEYEVVKSSVNWGFETHRLTIKK